MFGSQVLDVAIGLVFVYLLLSTVVSIVQEWIAQLTNLRANTLELAIKNMLNDPKAIGLAGDVFNHALVQGAGRRDFISSRLRKPGPPSYIPARVFSRALLDGVMKRAAEAATGAGPAVVAAAPGAASAVIAAAPTVGAAVVAAAPTVGAAVVAGASVLADASGASSAADAGALGQPTPANGTPNSTGSQPEPVAAASMTLQDVRTAIMALNQFPDAQKALLSLLDDSQFTVQDFRKNVEGWFDDTMDRVSGWYKRQTQVIILVIAVIVTLLLNVDSLAMASTLWMGPTTRAAVASAAEQYAVKTPPATNDNFQQRVVDLQSNLESLNLPLGWPANTQLPSTPQAWLVAAETKVPGWVLTILALSLGAPFWFDILNKLMNFRSAGPPPASQTS